MGAHRILFAGGGSGGHLMPGLAVAEELARRLPECEICFVTSGRGIDSRVLSDSRFESFPIPMTPLQKRPAELLRFATGFAKSSRVLKHYWKSTPPDVVVGLGGFTSVPVGVAAWREGTPLVLLEQNAIPGRATSLLAPLASQTCASFAETRRWIRCTERTIVTGNPVRSAISRQAPTPISERRHSRRVLLVLGGSQGAVGLNSMTLSAISRLRGRLSSWHIVHQTGERDAARVRAAYRQLGIDADVAAFFDDLPDRYGEAQFVISRAGATTLAELACCGLPAILVPYPRSARNHQDRNAELFARAGAAVVVHECAGAALTQSLITFLDDPRRRQTMSNRMRGLARPEAASNVADAILAHLAEISDRVESRPRAA